MSFDSENHQGLRAFEWPEKEVFFANRDQFVQRSIDHVQEFFIAQGLTQEKSEIASLLYLRAAFIARYMLSRLPAEVNPDLFKVGYADNIKNLDVKGFCCPVFQKNGKEVDLAELEKQDLDDIDLLYIKIALSLRAIYFECSHLLDSFKYSFEYHKEKGRTDLEATDIAKQSFLRELEESAIMIERCMVEEIAHAFYFYMSYRNKRRLSRIIQLSKAYQKMLLSVESGGINEQELAWYHNHPMEKSARYWVASFLKKYYPNSNTLRKVRFELNISSSD